MTGNRVSLACMEPCGELSNTSLSSEGKKSAEGNTAVLAECGAGRAESLQSDKAGTTALPFTAVPSQEIGIQASVSLCAP